VAARARPERVHHGVRPAGTRLYHGSGATTTSGRQQAPDITTGFDGAAARGGVFHPPRLRPPHYAWLWLSRSLPRVSSADAASSRSITAKRRRTSYVASGSTFPACDAHPSSADELAWAVKRHPSAIGSSGSFFSPASRGEHTPSVVHRRRRVTSGIATLARPAAVCRQPARADGLRLRCPVPT